MGFLDQELTPDEIGDLSVLEAAGSPPTSNLQRRPGESLQAWGVRLQASDRQLAAKAKASSKAPVSRKGQAKSTAKAPSTKARTRSGGSAGNFDQAHPRGRGGQWVVKQGGAGQTTAEVTAVQKRVGTKADGKFGNLTTNAVKSYQRKHGLQVDGVVGAQTVAALQGKRRAAQVKAGAMSAADRRWLLAHR